MDNKNKEEDEKMKNYLAEKERRDQLKDEKKRNAILENKHHMKNYLDMQVDEKRKMNDFEKTLNSEQARIWRIDTQRFYDQEKDINEKVRFMNTINSNYLKEQIDLKKGKNVKMSDAEYRLNKNILSQIKPTGDVHH